MCSAALGGEGAWGAAPAKSGAEGFTGVATKPGPSSEAGARTGVATCARQKHPAPCAPGARRAQGGIAVGWPCRLALRRRSCTRRLGGILLQHQPSREQDDAGETSAPLHMRAPDKASQPISCLCIIRKALQVILFLELPGGRTRVADLACLQGASPQRQEEMLGCPG